jgi:hypothetical protein
MTSGMSSPIDEISSTSTVQPMATRVVLTHSPSHCWCRQISRPTPPSVRAAAIVERHAKGTHDARVRAHVVSDIMVGGGETDDEPGTWRQVSEALGTGLVEASPLAKSSHRARQAAAAVELATPHVPLTRE